MRRYRRGRRLIEKAILRTGAALALFFVLAFLFFEFGGLILK